MQQMYYAATDAYVTLLLFYKIEATRAAQHQLIETPHQAYTSDSINELFNMSHGLPPVAQATNFGAHLPSVSTLHNGLRIVVFKDGTSVEHRLALQVAPAAQIRQHTKNVFVGKYGQIIKKDADGKKILSVVHPQPNQGNAAPSEPPRAAPQTLAPTPAVPASIPMVSVPRAVLDGMNQELAMLKAELNVAHQSIQHLIFQLDEERRRSAVLQAAAFVQYAPNMFHPLDASALIPPTQAVAPATTTPHHFQAKKTGNSPHRQGKKSGHPQQGPPRANPKQAAKKTNAAPASGAHWRRGPPQQD
jgi:hypothetical protein